MDKETYNQNFIHWDRVDKDALCDAMDNILGEAARKGDSIQHVADVVKALYEQFPGLKEYREERFQQACPSGEVFELYMPIPEVECLSYPDTTIAKAIDDTREPINYSNDTEIIRRQIRRIEFILLSIEDKLPAYDKVSKAVNNMSLMSISDTLCRIIGELQTIDRYKMKVISMLSEKLKEEIDENYSKEIRSCHYKHR